MAYTFAEIKNRVGQNIKYYDGSAWLTTRDVTETDVGDFINEIYTEDLFIYVQSRYPEFYRNRATADSWIATGTVNATSAGTTLVATTSIFNNSMIGLNVFNGTDNESAKIAAYTSASTVTLDTSIGDTWDGDTIYVLGQEFAIGGADAADIYEIEDVGIKFNSTAQYYTRCENRDETDFLQYGDELAIESKPFFYQTTTSVIGVPTTTIGVLPKFREKLSKAIKMTYTARPAEMSGDSDVPRVPSVLPLIYGATMRAYEKMQDYESAQHWQSRYELSRVRMLAQFKFKSKSKIRVKSRISDLHKRYI